MICAIMVCAARAVQHSLWQHKPLQRRPYRGQFLYLHDVCPIELQVNMITSKKNSCYASLCYVTMKKVFEENVFKIFNDVSDIGIVRNL